MYILGNKYIRGINFLINLFEMNFVLLWKTLNQLSH